MREWAKSKRSGSDQKYTLAVPRWLQGLLEVKQPGPVRCTASKSAIVCGFLRRAGIAGEPAPALDHVAEPVPLDGTGSMHARVECGWPGGLLGNTK